MRPLHRGATPTKPDGSIKTVTDYNNWRGDLVDRLDGYCSYCELPLTHSANVEHFVAQAINRSLSTDWDNLLLACSSCNGAKGKKACSTATHVVPTYHNGLIAFTYELLRIRRRGRPAEMGCIPKSRSGLSAITKQKAEATIRLCSLRNVKRTAKLGDARWLRRCQAADYALFWRQEWNGIVPNQQAGFIKLLLTSAVPSGFFSVWFEVFSDVPAVKQALIDAYPSTKRAACFDPINDYAPIERVAGDL